MTDEGYRTTYDGKPISPDPPYGATVVVYRRAKDAVEFLVLHRAHNGPDFEGDWAWTPPSGARFPGEAVEECAARELREEVGLVVEIRATAHSTLEWAVFSAEVEPGARILLAAEHDRYEWVSADEAVRRCQPTQVGRSVRLVADELE